MSFQGSETKSVSLTCISFPLSHTPSPCCWRAMNTSVFQDLNTFFLSQKIFVSKVQHLLYLVRITLSFGHSVLAVVDNFIS